MPSQSDFKDASPFEKDHPLSIQKTWLSLFRLI